MANIEVHIPESAIEDLAEQVAKVIKAENDTGDIDEVKELAEDLKTQVDDLESKVDDLDLDEIKDKIEHLESITEDMPDEYVSRREFEEIESTVDDLSDLKDDVAELKSAVHRLDVHVADLLRMGQRFGEFVNAIQVAIDRFTHS